METTDTSRETERADCISEAHLQFMRSYVEREERMSKAALERFLAQKLSQRDKVSSPAAKRL